MQKIKKEILEKIYNLKKNKDSKSDINKYLEDNNLPKEATEEINKIDLKKNTKKKTLAKIQKNIQKNFKKTQDKKPILTYIKTFFIGIYFFFENIYYSLLEKINKIIPINKITDKIDDVVPSFVIFILVLALLVYLLLFANIFVSEYSFSVNVQDELGNTLPNANVSLYRNEELLIQKTTDAFGLTDFYNIRARTVTVEIEKEKYIPKTEEVRLSKDTSFLDFRLSIDGDFYLEEYNTPERIRTISFITTNDLVITEKLNTNFICSNPSVTPEPSSKQITNGRVVVTAPERCGALRYNVTSNNYEDKSNQIVPDNDKIFLTKLTSKENTHGELSFKVRDLKGEAITNTSLTIYQQSRPSIAFNNGITDIYGKHVFEIAEGDYLFSASKQDYISVQKTGPVSVYPKEVTKKEVLLLTAKEIDEFDCSDSLYSDFCIGNHIDCTNELLKPYLSFDNDSCQLGIYKYIDVSLRDQETHETVFADIKIYRKPEDSNIFQATGLEAIDVNRSVFDVIEGPQYQVRVMNTEEKGYLRPKPITIETLDTNITVDLEFSSELNSGDINVTVFNEHGYTVYGSSVYLYYGDGEHKDSLFNDTPKITPNNGLVNFSTIPSQNKYYAFAISSDGSLEGQSETYMIDANETTDFSVTLKDSPKVLNFKANTNDYDLMFFNSLGEPIFSYIETDTENTGEKRIVFTERQLDSVYAFVSSSAYAGYLTNEIRLSYNREANKTINLKTTTACPSADIEYLGLFNKNTNEKIDQIDFDENGLDNDKYVLRYVFHSCGDTDNEYAFVRTGNKTHSEDDALYIDSINHFPVLENLNTFGTRFAGELMEWDEVHFINNYELDHSQSSDVSKWVKIDFTDFSDFDASTYEFSVNINFNDIGSQDDYVSYYRAFSAKNENYAFDPYPSNFNPDTWTIERPDCFFYAPTEEKTIDFDTENIYDFSIYEKDSLRSVRKSGGSYVFFFSEDEPGEYVFDLNILYLMKDKVSTFYLGTEQTNGNLLYKNYNLFGFEDAEQTSRRDTGKRESASGFVFEDLKEEFTVEDLFAKFGKSYNIRSDFKVKDIFSTTTQPNMVYNFFEDGVKEINIRSYYDGEYQTIVETEGYNNQIYFGENKVTFRVLNNENEPVENVEIKRTSPSSTSPLCCTDKDGTCTKDITIDNHIIENFEQIEFSFTLTDVGAHNNKIGVVSKDLFSGFKILDSNKEEIDSENNLIYDVVLLHSGSYVVQSNLTEQEYYIQNLTSKKGLLEEIIFNSHSQLTQFLDIDEISRELESNEGNLKSFSNNDGLNLITAPIIFNLEQIPTSGFDSENNFRNVVKLELEEMQDVVLLLDADVIVNVLNLDIGTGANYTSHTYGVYETREKTIGVELIKNELEEIDIEYNLKNNSSEKIEIKKIVLEIDQPIINKEKIDISLAEDLFGQTLDVGEAIDFNIPIEAHSSGNTKVQIKIEFVFDPEGVAEEFSLPIVLDVDVYNKENLLNINVESFTENPINCNKGNCKLQGNYKITNNTKSHSFSLENISYDAEELNNLFEDVSFERNTIVDKNSSKQVSFTIDIDADKIDFGEIYENKDIDIEFLFNHSIKNIEDVSFKRSHNFTVFNYENIEDVPSIEGELCIGYGGQEIDGSFIVIGNCETEEEVCQTGESAVPKIVYDWADRDEIKDCVVDDLDTDANLYCDSTQMLINMFYEIADGFDDFYIDLMGDRVSNRMFEDFIDCMFSEDPICDVLPMLQATIKKLNQEFNDFIKDEEKTINLSRNNYEPGRYLVSFNDFNLDDDPDDLEITITLRKTMPTRESNLFYYLPINYLLLNYENRDYGFDIGGVFGELMLDPLNGDTHVINNQIDSSVDDESNVPVLNLEVFTNNLERAITRKNNILSITKNRGENQDIYNFSYVPTIPSIVYAKSSCVDTSDLEYVLVNPEEQVETINKDSFLTWTLNNEEIDDQKQIDKMGVYTNHVLKISSDSIQNKLLKTNVYLPKDFENSNDYKLTLDRQMLENNPDSNFYWIEGNSAEEGREISFGENTRKVDQDIISKLNNLTDLFDLIKEENLCVLNTHNSTQIYWVEEKLDYSQEEINLIEQKAEVDNIDYCPKPADQEEQRN